MAVEVRLLAANDVSACNDLHNQAYGRKRRIDQWNWEFIPKLFHTDIVPFAVVDDHGAIVGTQALIPIRMIDATGVYWTAKSEETLVDPRYRGQKLFERMYTPLFAYAHEHGLRHIWGFTPATNAFTRIGFAVPGTTRQLLYPFRSRDIVALAGGGVAKRLLVPTALLLARCWSRFRQAQGRRTSTSLQVSGSVTLRTLTQPPAEAEELCRAFIARYGGTTIFRDADYLNWRIFGNPYIRPIMRAAYAGDKLLGWTIWSLGDDGMGYLVDVFAASDSLDDKHMEDAVVTLLVDAVAGLRSTGASGVRGWRVTDHPFDQLVTRAAKRAGFLLLKRGHPVVVYTDPTLATPVDSQLLDQWYISRIYTEGLAG